ncbi:Ribosomal_protein S7 [Hexamita inflata]|uniref:40S ribosomal protein S7 n=1 Tax=Hexamita inflata TaxID=28002 RepID=A0AA86TFU4_9EUKA|nr:Ribosomal protein S7 [Hexamita inflata]CAI9939973.1 Ribosomal protein S7 [Hexamita inflata]
MQFKQAAQTEIEKNVHNAMTKLAADKTINIKLADLHVTKVKTIAVPNHKTACVIYVPCNEIATFKQDEHLVAALEKQIVGHQVHIVADRKIEHRTPKGYRAFCKTSVAVHANLLEDLVAPAYIAGKRIQYTAGQKLNKFLVAKVRKAEVENRVAVCSKVYEALTGIKNQIDFM